MHARHHLRVDSGLVRRHASQLAVFVEASDRVARDRRRASVEAAVGGGGRGGRGGERALVETTHSKVHFIGRKEGRGIYRLVVFYLLLLYYYHDRAVARHIPSRRLSCSSTFLIRSLNPSSPPVGSVYGGAMEISSKTTMTWSFHRHGSVRANASKISCACSVTFSPMLSE